MEQVVSFMGWRRGSRAGDRRNSLPANFQFKEGSLRRNSVTAAIRSAFTFRRKSQQAIQEQGGHGLDGVLERAGTGAFLTVTPVNTSRTLSRDLSFQSSFNMYVSDRPYGDTKFWNEPQLLKFFDNVRQALLAYPSPGDRSPGTIMLEVTRGLEDPSRPHRQLTELLSELVDFFTILTEDEQSPKSLVSIDFIVHTHIDKLLEELPLYVDVLPTEEIQTLAEQAKFLRSLWEDRLDSDWQLINVQRMREMKSTGCFRDMVRMDCLPDWRVTHEFGWVVDEVAGGAKAEGSLGYQPGHWWLHLDFAKRDGVVSNSTESLTKGRYGVTALAMMTGEETDGEEPNTVMYSSEGEKREMPFSLLGNQQPVRVLRGSHLKSPYAPSFGVRYDGLYKITTFSLKLLDDPTTTRYRYSCRIGLTRLSSPSSQPSFDLALKHPTPSEVDQFMLYWQHVGAEVLGRLGRDKFAIWADEDVDEKKCREWVGRLRGLRRRRAGFNGDVSIGGTP